MAPHTLSAVDDRRSRQRRLLLAFCALSLGLHVGLVLGWIFFPGPSTPAIDLDSVVKTRLVKLGKPRDEKLLPRLTAQAPPPPADKKAPPSPNDTPTPDKPAPAADKKPTAAELLEKFSKENNKKDVNDILKRIGEESDEGQLEGDAEGTELTGEIKKTYFARLIAHIRRHMEVSSTLSDDERVRLKARLSIRVDADGNVLAVKIAESSGSSVFDNDVVTAAKRSSPVPAPPPPVRALVEDGVAINFCPVSCS